MINAILCVFFILITISVVGICSYVYAGKPERKNGMILGMHVPDDAVLDDSLLALTRAYTIGLRRFQWINLVIGLTACAVCAFQSGIGLLLWAIWLIGYCIVLNILLIRAQRRMYALKVRKNWFIGQTHPGLAVDTRVTARAGHFPCSWKWHLLPLLLWVIFWSIPALRLKLCLVPGGCLFLLCFTLLPVFFLALHQCLATRKNNVYSQESTVNEAINYLEKHTWTLALVIADVISAAAGLYLILSMLRSGRPAFSDYMIYAFIDLAGASAIIIGIIHIFRRRSALLGNDAKPLLVDDDEYWKNGWYFNPQDRHLLIQNRMCATNYTMNMAHPAAKWLLGASAILCIAAIALCIGIGVTLFRLDSASVTLTVNDDAVTVDYAFYDCSFFADDIRSLKLIDALPDEYFRRTNGGDTDRVLIGHFQGEFSGNTMMFIYKNKTPVIKIQLAQQTVFINSTDSSQTQRWYEQLCSLIS